MSAIRMFDTVLLRDSINPSAEIHELAYFELFCGISGDMTLGAIVDAGCDLALLRSVLQGLQVPGWPSPPKKSGKTALSATFVRLQLKTRPNTAAFRPFWKFSINRNSPISCERTPPHFL